MKQPLWAKIDFMATDEIGREHQVATVQLDFVQPQRFGLEYAESDGSFTTPVMIHCALLGSIELLFEVYLLSIRVAGFHFGRPQNRCES